MSVAADLARFVGAAARPPTMARDPVNLAMVHHWCDAIGDENPVYTDPVAAASSRHGGMVAPPTMLQAWAMTGLRPPPVAPDEDVMGQLMQALDEAGYTSIVATNCEQDYPRYLREGDTVTMSAIIESISEEKQTALGKGIFVTLRQRYSVDGELVGTMLFRVLKFRPSPTGGATTPPALARRPRPAINDDNRFFWDGVAQGELRIQRCQACSTLRHPPAPACAACGSLQWDSVKASGRGSVFSYAVPRHPAIPPFTYPHVVVLVELEEGTRLVSNLIDVEPEGVDIGMPVEVCFVAAEDDLVLPQFRPAEAPS